MQIQQNTNRGSGPCASASGVFPASRPCNSKRWDLHDLLADAIHLLNRLVGERVTLNRCAMALTFRLIRSDQAAVSEQVLMNLVVNARRYAMAMGGEIVIETEYHAPSQRDATRQKATLPPGELRRDPGPATKASGMSHATNGKSVPTRFFQHQTARRKEQGWACPTVYGIVNNPVGFNLRRQRRGARHPHFLSKFRGTKPLRQEFAVAAAKPDQSHWQAVRVSRSTRLAGQRTRAPVPAPFAAAGLCNFQGHRVPGKRISGEAALELPPRPKPAPGCFRQWT